MKDKLLHSLHQNLIKINKEIAKQDNVGSNKLVAISKLANSYTKLLKQTALQEQEQQNKGKKNYHEILEQGGIRMKDESRNN